MGVFRPGIDMQVAHLRPAQRAPGDHALNRLFDNAFREAAFHAFTDGAALDAARITRVPIEHALFRLGAGDAHLVRIDDDNMVTTINMRGELRLVLAAKAIGDQGGETAEHEPIRINQHPVLLHLRRLQRAGLCGDHGGSE